MKRYVSDGAVSPKPLRLVPPLLLVALAAACGGSGQSASSDAGEGVIRASVRFEQVGGPDPDRVEVEIQPDSLTVQLEYDVMAGDYIGTLSLRPGTRTITANAYAGDLLLGSGATTAVITSHGSVDVTIRILDGSGAGPVQDHGPIINVLNASSTTPMAGDAITLSAQAVDPDGNAVSYHWTQNCNGSIAMPNSATTTWSSATVQTCTLTVTATSRALHDSRTVTIDVKAVTGNLRVGAVFVPQPFVISTQLSGDGLACRIPRDATDASCRPPIARGTVLAATVSFDPMPSDSGATVTLSDDCQGVTSNPVVDLKSGVATFDWTAPSYAATCLVTAQVTRETLSDAQTVAVEVL